MFGQKTMDVYIEELVDQYMEQYRLEMIASFEEMSSARRIPVKEISLALTNRCNCHCVMCQVVTEETKKTGN